MPSVDDVQTPPARPLWRTSRHSPGGGDPACVQAGDATLNLRDGSIRLGGPDELGPLVLLRAPGGPKPQAVAESSRAAARKPVAGTTSWTGPGGLPTSQEWLARSTVRTVGLVTGRSAELRRIDDAVGAVNNDHRSVALLGDLLDKIKLWRNKGGDKNPRIAAVTQLEGRARAARRGQTDQGRRRPRRPPAAHLLGGYTHARSHPGRLRSTATAAAPEVPGGRRERYAL
nr:hypothetical protein GCM10025730_22070 [Promicromonospora thailandica]